MESRDLSKVGKLEVEQCNHKTVNDVHRQGHVASPFDISERRSFDCNSEKVVRPGRCVCDSPRQNVNYFRTNTALASNNGPFSRAAILYRNKRLTPLKPRSEKLENEFRRLKQSFLFSEDCGGGNMAVA